MNPKFLIAKRSISKFSECESLMAARPAILMEDRDVLTIRTGHTAVEIEHTAAEIEAAKTGTGGYSNSVFKGSGW